MKTIKVSAVHHWEGDCVLAQYTDERGETTRALGWTAYGAIRRLQEMICDTPGELMAVENSESLTIDK